MVTVEPSGQYFTAFSIKFLKILKRSSSATSTVTLPSWSYSSKPNTSISMFFFSASAQICSMTAATVSDKTAFFSLFFTDCIWARFNERSWETNRVARSMLIRRSASCFWACSFIVAFSSRSAWSERAANGDLSSWAASATKRDSLCLSSSIRNKTPLNASTIGSNSVGNPCVSIGVKSSGWRRLILEVSAWMGFIEYHKTPAKIINNAKDKPSSGREAANAVWRAIFSISFIRWATAICCPPESVRR